MFRPHNGWLIAALLLASTAGASARTAQIDSNLNLREGPGPQHRVIVVMPAGATVTVGECRREWCQVEYRRQRGYVNSALIKGGDGAFAAAPDAAPTASKYNADDGARVMQWQDREWRDRYLRDIEMRNRR